PDQREILADLEQAIADKCGRYLGPHKNVVASEEVAEVLREMGPVDGGAEASAVGGSANSPEGAASVGAGATSAAGVGPGFGAAAGGGSGIGTGFGGAS